MDKKLKIALFVVAAAGLIYWGFWYKKPTQEIALTDAEKLGLFITAQGYRGGVPPPEQVLVAAGAAATAAQERIAALGLQAEYEAYLQAHSNDALVQ